MKHEEGAWIDVPANTSEFTSKGLPKQGDKVIVEYIGHPYIGIITSIVKRDDENAVNSFTAKELGVSFAMAATFAVI
jgi:hypothetical protein